VARALTCAALLFVTVVKPVLADEVAIPDDIVRAATDAGLDPLDLAGALNTTGLDANTYLCVAEHLNCPKIPDVAFSSVWYRLANCESNGRWSINTFNGYYGGLQEDMAFWIRYGGLKYADRPDHASPSAQITVASRGQAVQGWGAWPRCSRLLGLLR